MGKSHSEIPSPPPNRKPAMVLLATHAMGTRFEIVLGGDGEESQRRAVGEEALREIEHWHGRLSRFLLESDTTRVNIDPNAPVDDDFRGLLALCERVKDASGGAFDPRVGAGRTLDFGAIGKGFALDRAAAIVREQGIGCAMLQGGTSSVIAIGSPPGTDAWRIAIRSAGERLQVVLRDRVVGVSAPRGRVDPTGAGHILDPRTGQAAATAVDTAVVITSLGVPNAAALCDAWSTALVVLGEIPPAFPAGFEAHLHTRSGWTSHAAGVMGAA